MSEFDLTPLDTRVLAALQSGFPVSESPYCDLAAELGASESDVLNSAEKLRETGAVARIAVIFSDPDAFASGASVEDADLAQLVSFDLPWSEHPFTEVAAQLELRGISMEPAEVIERVRDWLLDGTASEVVALSE
ncbi:MAG: Lrp/AsnC family transcriptional regulator [Coriobacteriia bacterium]|nr:Lrp/AsnC family transcriptional regulator [Coriobacteriia bacterium]